MTHHVYRLPVGKPIKRIFPSGLTPYITSTGIQIGIFYEAPQKYYMTELEEFWQAVLLEIEPEWSQRRVAIYMAYCMFIIFVLMLGMQGGW